MLRVSLRRSYRELELGDGALRILAGFAVFIGKREIPVRQREEGGLRNRLLPKLKPLFGLGIKQEVAQVIGRAGIVRVGSHGPAQHWRHFPLEREHNVWRIGMTLAAV